jgi:hypothetical protein
MQPEGNPRVTHNGTMSVFHLTLTKDQATGIKTHLETNLGCKVKADPMDEETSDQAAERGDLLGIGREDEIFPCSACPTCFWFDPLIDGFCGWTGWPKETREQALVSHEAARTNIEDCPVH